MYGTSWYVQSTLPVPVPVPYLTKKLFYYEYGNF
jgi:hypothetical protein